MKIRLRGKGKVREVSSELEKLIWSFKDKDSCLGSTELQAIVTYTILYLENRVTKKEFIEQLGHGWIMQGGLELSQYLDYIYSHEVEWRKFIETPLIWYDICIKDLNLETNKCSYYTDPYSYGMQWDEVQTESVVIDGQELLAHRLTQIQQALDDIKQNIQNHLYSIEINTRAKNASL